MGGDTLTWREKVKFYGKKYLTYVFAGVIGAAIAVALGALAGGC